MRFTRMIVTAATARWVDAAVSAFTGYGTSVIQCDAEVGLERLLDPSETFDGRPGAAMLAFGFSYDALAKAIGKRSGQCLMTCATTAVFDGYPQQQYLEDQQRILDHEGDRAPETNSRRQPPPVLWRWISEEQDAGRASVLADSCDGWGVHLRAGCRRRQRRCGG